MSSQTLLFELLQVALDLRASLSYVPAESEWAEVFALSKVQGVSGIAYAGLRKLSETYAMGSETLTPTSITFLQWTGWVQDLRERNAKVSHQGETVERHFQEDGFWCKILKGQSMQIYYPEELADLREPGDIDIWVALERPDLLAQKGEKAIEESINRVISYCRNIAKGTFVYYHHLDFPVLKGTECEVHYRPALLNSPRRNRRLQKWLFEDYSDDSTYQLVYLLIHAYRHACADAIRCKMLLDIYFVMTSVLVNTANEDWKAKVEAPLRLFGALSFAKAVMAVFDEMLNLKLSCFEPDLRRGRTLHSSMMRYDGKEHGPHWYARCRQSAATLCLYPHEAAWHIPFTFRHLWWQYRHKL